MIRTLSLSAIVAAATVMSLAWVPARAQQARGGGGAVSAQMAAELQQLGSERTALEAENTRLKQQLAAAQRQLGTLKKGAGAATARLHSSEAALERSNASTASAQRQLAEVRASERQLIAKFRQVIATLRKTEIDDSNTRRTLARREQDLKVCTRRNRALYKLDDQVLTHFAHLGFWARLASDEPFTQIERTRLENYSEESRHRAEEQRYTPPPGARPGKRGTSSPRQAVSAPPRKGGGVKGGGNS